MSKKNIFVAVLFVFMAGSLAEAVPGTKPMGAGVQTVCSSSAPGPTATNRTWVRCSDKHLMQTNASNADTDIQSGGVSLSTANTWTKSQNVSPFALTDGTSIATDASQSNIFTVTLGGNRTLANPTNLVSGGTYLFVVKQDITGTRTLAYGNLFKWPGGTAPTLTTTASATDMISCLYNGTILMCVSQLNFQ